MTHVKPDLKVDWCIHEAAKYACFNWHYSKCIPKSKLVKIGAWENNVFIGVVIFSYGATIHLVNPYGLKMNQGCELTRIALNNHISFVSEILGCAIRFLKKSNPGIRLIVSYADTGQGHNGTIYQATNWIYEGLFGGESYLKIDGEIIHRKTAYDRYKTSSVKKIKGSEKVIAASKHKYLMPLDKKMRKQILPLSKPYPKRSKQAMADTIGTATGQNRSERSIMNKAG